MNNLYSDVNNVILLDGSFAAVPIYQSLMERFSNVYVLSGRKSDTLKDICKNYINIDYADVAKVNAFAQEIGTNNILPGCNDVSYYTASRCRSALTVTTDLFDTLNNKLKFRNLLRSLNLRTPKVASPECVDSLGYPFLIKRQISYSGKGITKIYQKEELSVCDFNPSVDLLEEYIPGQLKSASCILVDGAIVSMFVVNEFGDNYEFRVDRSYVDTGLKNSEVSEVSFIISTIVDRLKIDKGLFHLQYIKNNSGEIYPIEATLRFPGDLYGLLIEKSLGVSYFGSILDALIGNPIKKEVCQKRRIERRTLFFHAQTSSELGIPNSQFYPVLTGNEDFKNGDRIGVRFEEMQ